MSQVLQKYAHWMTELGFRQVNEQPITVDFLRATGADIAEELTQSAADQLLTTLLAQKAVIPVFCMNDQRVFSQVYLNLLKGKGQVPHSAQALDIFYDCVMQTHKAAYIPKVIALKKQFTTAAQYEQLLTALAQETMTTLWNLPLTSMEKTNIDVAIAHTNEWRKTTPVSTIFPLYMEACIRKAQERYLQASFESSLRLHDITVSNVDIQRGYVVAQYNFADGIRKYIYTPCVAMDITSGHVIFHQGVSLEGVVQHPQMFNPQVNRKFSELFTQCLQPAVLKGMQSNDVTVQPLDEKDIKRLARLKALFEMTFEGDAVKLIAVGERFFVTLPTNITLLVSPTHILNTSRSKLVYLREQSQLTPLQNIELSLKQGLLQDDSLTQRQKSVIYNIFAKASDLRAKI